MPLLSEYVDGADLVVVATVLSAEKHHMTETNGTEWDNVVALLRPETVLHGSVDMEKPVAIENFYFAGADLEEVVGKRYLVIATVDDEDKQFRAQTAREVGEPEVLEAYTDRVRELIDVLALAEGTARDRQMAEWAVRCVEEAPTRCDGVHELFRLAPSDDGAPPQDDPIDPSLRERLIRMMLASTHPADDGADDLAGFLGRYHEGRVLDYLERRLEDEVRTPSGATMNVMSMMADQLDWRTGQWLTRNYPYDKSVGRRRAAVARFIALMRTRKELPKALAADEPEQSDAEIEAVSGRETVIREAEQRYEFDPETAITSATDEEETPDSSPTPQR
jgi:hypothetical protein